MNAHITENNTPAIPAATIARTVVLALALVNQLLSAAGKPVLPIDSASVEQWVTAGLTTAARHLGMVGEQQLYSRGHPRR